MLEDVYRQRPSRIPGAVVWTTVSRGEVRRILPDACMDLVWDGDHVMVAGPDTTAFLSLRSPGAMAVGVRFAPGALPSVLGVPAHVLRDEHVLLGDVWQRSEVDAIEESISAAPSTA